MGKDEIIARQEAGVNFEITRTTQASGEFDRETIQVFDNRWASYQPIVLVIDADNNTQNRVCRIVDRHFQLNLA